MTSILVPEPLGPDVNMRWFTEYLIDNSPLFKSTSAVAKASLILAADLDTVGAKPEINESGLKLIRDALSSETQPFDLPELMATRTDAEGKQVGDPVRIPPRVYTRFIDAWMTDVT